MKWKYSAFPDLMSWNWCLWGFIWVLNVPYLVRHSRKLCRSILEIYGKHNKHMEWKSHCFPSPLFYSSLRHLPTCLAVFQQYPWVQHHVAATCGTYRFWRMIALLFSLDWSHTDCRLSWMVDSFSTQACVPCCLFTHLDPSYKLSRLSLKPLGSKRYIF